MKMKRVSESIIHLIWILSLLFYKYKLCNMDQTTKFLLKLGLDERNMLLGVLQQILSLDLEGLDIKKLQWETNLFRVRKGKIRIIFRKDGTQGVIIDMNYRDKIYKWL